MVSTAENDTSKPLGLFCPIFLAFSHQAGLPVIPKNYQNEKLPDNPKYKKTLCPFNGLGSTTQENRVTTQQSVNIRPQNVVNIFPEN